MQEKQPAAQIAARRTIYFIRWRHIFHFISFIYSPDIDIEKRITIAEFRLRLDIKMSVRLEG